MSPSHSLKGIILLSIATLIIPFSDGIAKILSQSFPVIEVVWFRFLFQTLIFTPLTVSQYGLKSLNTGHWGLQILRATSMSVAIISYYVGLQYLPLATLVAIFFFSPLIVTGMSPIVLNEQLTKKRIMAVIFGIIGVLIIVRPGVEIFNFGYIFAILAGISHGIFMLLTSKLSNRVNPLTTLTITGGFGCFILLLFIDKQWQLPTTCDESLMICVYALNATISQAATIRAYQMAEASLLSPFNFLELISAAFVGYFMFNNVPSLWVWLGASIIILSTLSVMQEEKMRNKIQI